MKIAYVSNSRFPSERAHAVQIVQMCNAFVEQGNEVTLFVTNRATSITEAPEDFYGTTLLFSVVRVPVPDIAGNAHKLPKFVRPFAYTLQRIFFAVRTWLCIRSDAFDLIYGRDEWVLWFLSFFVQTHIVWESHEAKHSLPARRLLRFCKNIVVISEGIRDFYISKDVEPKKILVAHDAIDESFFTSVWSKQEARKALCISSNKPVVMYIGGLDEWKGVQTLFRAAKGSENIFSTYVIGGKESEIKMYQSNFPYICFLGPRPYRELKNYQQAADILVIPNTAKNKLSAEYTSPLKLFAHMTSRVPIVASNIPSIRNVLSENEAYFFSADNSYSLAETIQKVVQNPEDAALKAQAAYALSLKYTWRERAKAIVGFVCSKL